MSTNMLEDQGKSETRRIASVIDRELSPEERIEDFKKKGENPDGSYQVHAQYRDMGEQAEVDGEDGALKTLQARVKLNSYDEDAGVIDRENKMY